MRNATLALAGVCLLGALGAVLTNLRTERATTTADQHDFAAGADGLPKFEELDMLLPPLAPNALATGDVHEVENTRRDLYQDILRLRARAAVDANGLSSDTGPSGGSPLGAAIPKQALKELRFSSALGGKYLRRLAARHHLTFEKILEIEEEGQSKGWVGKGMSLPMLK